MASTSKSANWSGDSRFSLIMNLNESYVSGGVENYSNVSWNLQLKSTSSYRTYTGYAENPLVAYVNGQLVSNQNITYDLQNNTITVASGTIKVPHNSDGSKTISFSASFTDNSNGKGSASLSGSLTLTKINRYATVTSAPDFNDEENPVLKYSNPSGNNVSTLQACISLTGATDDIPYRDISKTGSSYTFELTEEERNILRNATPNSNSISVRFYVKTVLGSTTYYDYKTKTMTIVNGNPTFSDYTYQDTNTTVSNLLGTNQKLVKGLSNLKVTIPVANKMEAIKGASPSKYIASIDTLNASGNYNASGNVDIVLGAVQNAGTFNLNVGAYDTRNNHTDIIKEVEVLDYSLPVLYATATRTNNFENETTLTLNGTFSNLLVNNVNKNAITSCQYRYREVDGTWSNYSNFVFTSSGNNYSCTNKIENLDNTKAYEIEFKVSDRLSYKTLNLIVDVGKSIFFIDKKNRLLYYNDVEMLQYDVVEEWSD